MSTNQIRDYFFKNKIAIVFNNNRQYNYIQKYFNRDKDRTWTTGVTHVYTYSEKKHNCKVTHCGGTTSSRFGYQYEKFIHLTFEEFKALTDDRISLINIAPKKTKKTEIKEVFLIKIYVINSEKFNSYKRDYYHEKEFCSHSLANAALPEVIREVEGKYMDAGDFHCEFYFQIHKVLK